MKRTVKNTSILRPWRFKLHRYWGIGLVLFGSTMLTLILFIYMRNLDYSHLYHQFRTDASIRTSMIRDVMNENYMDVTAVQRFYYSSVMIDRAEFREFINPLFQQTQRWNYGLAWSPWVKHSQRAEMENEISGLNQEIHSFWEYGPNRVKIPLPIKEFYLPIYYIEPMETRSELLGFDEASDTLRLKSILAARDSNRITATERINLAGSGIEQTGFLMCAPIYINNSDISSVKARQENFRGILLGAFNFKNLVDLSIQATSSLELNTILYDRSAPKSRQFLYEWSPIRSMIMEKKDWMVNDSMLTYIMDFQFAERVYRIEITASRFYVDQQLSGNHYYILILGLVLSLVMAAYIHNVYRHRLEAEAMVEDKVSQLKNAELRFRAVFDQTLQFIVLLDLQGYILAINRSSTDFIGLDESSLIGRRFCETPFWSHSPEMQFRFKEAMIEVMKDRLIRFETTHFSADHQLNCFDFSLKPFKNSQGAILFLIGESRDISQIKSVQSALAESEQTARALLNASRDAILMLDSEGRVLRANEQAMVRFSQFDSFPLIGSRLDDWPVKDGYSQWRSSLDEAVNTGGAVFYEIQYRDRWLENTIYPIFDSSGQVMKLALYSRDITARKLEMEEKRILEEKLIRSEKMEALGRLAGGVAHDLNNLLTGIVSYPDMILLKVPASHPFADPLRMIKQAGERAAAIIQDLLTLSRRGVIKKEVTNLNKVVENYIRSPEFQNLQKRNPDMRLETANSPDLFNVLCSGYNLFKLIMNLVGNAAESMPQGGLIMLTTRNCYLDQTIMGYDTIPEGEYVMLGVKDQGSGIAPEDMKKIFEPFYTKKVMGRSSGTGLGMSVIWGIIKDHQGFIDIQSQLGQGTLMQVYFPICRQPEKTNTPVANDQYRGNRETILVVDDSQEQRLITGNILKELNYRVAIAGSGEEAVAYLVNHSVELVILDMIMEPGMDGLETYRQIQKIIPSQKAIIVSGYTETERVEELKRLGVRLYIQKPYTIEKLGMAIREVLKT
ncbi:MAG: CHASE domain-containing protein [Candidatus Delongbacteria bacterium]|nr:CHASE domain-containing protein [Candidatus Delongbacteria bacterium]